MKIIHTADIHLDSPINGVKNSSERRADLLRALANMSDVASNIGAKAIIIAGDLFDDECASSQTVQSVAQLISQSPVQWFILKGNHGNDLPYNMLASFTNKAKFFGDDWTTYLTDNVAITGRELGSHDADYWKTLKVDPSKYNVLVLHGDLDDDRYGIIDKKAIQQSNVNYVALGHRHAFCEHKFGKVRACYSGVLEARGFDETAETGFVVIDTDSDKISFYPQHIRRVETVQLDVSGITTSLALERKLLDSISDVAARNYLNVEFVGTLAEGVNPKAAASVLQDRFFALRVKDLTVPSYDLDKLQQEVSLRGEFVKLALQISDQETRNSVIKLGLDALGGNL